MNEQNAAEAEDLTKAKPETKNEKSEKSGTAYPFYSLKEIIEFAEAVRSVGGNEADEDEVLKHLGLTTKTTRSWSYKISSAREFNLVARVGRGAARLQLTPLCQRILMPGSDAEGQAARMEAFLSPELYRHIATRYRGAPVPTDRQLANVLERDFKLIPSVSVPAANAFIDSARYAGFIVANSFKKETTSTAVEPIVETQRQETEQKEDPAKPEPPAEAGSSRSIELASGVVLTISLSRELLKLPREERTFVLELIDKLDEREDQQKQKLNAPMPPVTPIDTEKNTMRRA